MLKKTLSSVLRTTPQKILLLKGMGIHTVQDLLMHYPFRYEDRSENTSRGVLSPIRSTRTRFGKSIQKATFTDEDGSTMECVWFHQNYLAREWAVPKQVSISGKVQLRSGRMVYVSPVIEPWNGQQLHTGGIIPIYHETEGISSAWLREKIATVIDDSDEIREILPSEILQDYEFPNKADSVRTVHLPKDPDQLKKARERLAFEELFLLQLSAVRQKKRWQDQGGAVAMPMDPELIKDFQKTLPFQLTNAQKIALFQILKDCEKSQPMLRLLQGDVGSGKTVVAAMAMLPFLKKGYQCAVMSPTEILAQQHFSTLRKLLPDVSSVLLIGSVAEKEKEELRKRILVSDIQLIVGTHALIQQALQFSKLAFAVIDEQHRFGVAQRAELLKKCKNIVPHLLMMSATPIPRTLALTIYGDQELSIIDEMPPGRKPVITRVIPQCTRKKASLFIDDHITKGHQVFVICPLIEESEKLEVKSVLQEYERLKTEDFPHRRVRYLHGKMKPQEKEEIMKQFQDQAFDILVSTSVVEVGVDIPQATIMVIEGAERFGLSQLHQFRGRVGRNDVQSYCFLYTSDRQQRSTRRLKAMVDHTDGFRLAEIDLEIRGAGEVYGLKQSGLPDLKMASLMDGRTIALARQKAQEIIDRDPDLQSFPELKNQIANRGEFWKA